MGDNSRKRAYCLAIGTDDKSNRFWQLLSVLMVFCTRKTNRLSSINWSAYIRWYRERWINFIFWTDYDLHFFCAQYALVSQISIALITKSISHYFLDTSHLDHSIRYLTLRRWNIFPVAWAARGVGCWHHLHQLFGYEFNNFLKLHTDHIAIIMLQQLLIQFISLNRLL